MAVATTDRWKAYPAYRDSGVEWLGEIPAEWDLKRLKNAADIVMGQSPPSEEYELDGGGLPFLQGNAEFGALYPEPRLYCSTAPKRAQRGAILLSVRAPVGALNVADRTYGIGRGLCAVAVRSEILDREYAYSLLKTLGAELATAATGSTYDAVDLRAVASLSCLLPSLGEQRIIAGFLDRETAEIDALIEKKERLIELLEEKRAALISRIATDGDAEWPIAPLKRISPEITVGIVVTPARYYTQTGVPCLRGVNVSPGRVLDSDLVFIGEAANARHAKSVLRAGDIVVVRSGQAGAAAVVPEWADGGNCVDLLIIRRGTQADSRFLEYALNSEATIRQIEYGTVGAIQGHFNVGSLKDVRISLPSLARQREIVALLDRETAKIDALVARIREHIERLREYRTALISAAVTGKIDVRDEVPA